MLLCVALNIQVQLDGITNYRVYAEQVANIKTNDITNRLIQGVVSLCTCDFNSSLLVNPFIVCFDGSQQYVTYRTTLTGMNAMSARELVALYIIIYIYIKIQKHIISKYYSLLYSIISYY